jgi:hypothetical protein
VGIEPQKIAPAWAGNSNHSAGYGIFLRHQVLQEHFQTLPAATAQFRKECTIIEEITSKDFGDAEDEMSMGYGLDHLLAEPFSKLHHPLLMAGGTETFLSAISETRLGQAGRGCGVKSNYFKVPSCPSSMMGEYWRRCCSKPFFSPSLIRPIMGGEF